MRAPIPVPDSPAAWAYEVVGAFSSATNRLLLITLRNSPPQGGKPHPELERLVDLAPDLALEARGIAAARPVRRRAARASHEYLVSQSSSAPLPLISAFIGAYVFSHVGVGLLSSGQASSIRQALEQDPQLLRDAVSAAEISRPPSVQASFDALVTYVMSRRAQKPDEGTN